MVEQRGRVYRCQVSCFLKIAGAGQAGCLLIPIDMYHGDTKSLQQERARAHCLWVVVSLESVAYSVAAHLPSCMS